MAVAQPITQLPPPRRVRPRRKPLTETQRNLRSAANMQTKVESHKAKLARQDTSHKASAKVRVTRQSTPIREQSAIRVIQARGATKVQTEGQIAAARTQQRIIQQDAAERGRTKGYLIRHTGSRAITTTGQALKPSVNPFSLVFMVGIGLILFYLFVANSGNTNSFLGRLGDSLTTLSSTKPLFTREQ